MSGTVSVLLLSLAIANVAFSEYCKPTFSGDPKALDAGPTLAYAG